VPYSQRDIDHDRHSRELDEAKEAKQVEEGYYGRVERQQIEEAHKANLQERPAGAGVPEPLSPLQGDRRREAVRARNREALQRFEQQINQQQRDRWH